MAQLLGYTEDELLSTPFSDIFVSGTPDSHADGVSRFMLQCKKKGGELVTLRCNSVVSDSSDPNKGLNIVAQTSEVNKLTEKIIQSTQFFRLVTEATTEAKIIADNRGMIVWCNDIIEKMLGYGTVEIMHKSMLMLIPDKCRAAHEKTVSRFLKTGEGGMDGKVNELSVRCKDGSEIPVEISISTVFFNKKWHVSIAIRDISQRKAMEAEVRQAKNIEAISVLCAGIAHDLNNELLVFMMFLDEVESISGIPLSIVEKSTRMRAHVTHSSGLLRKVLQFGQQVQHAERVNFNISQLLQEVIEVIHASMRAVRIETRLSVQYAYADKGSLRQVLINLILNACDAMPEGGEVVISTSLYEGCSDGGHPHKAAGKFIHIAVSDQGMGIDPEHREKIFDPFYTTKTNGKGKSGSGLGLSMVMRMVKEHNGYLTVDSEVGKGTTFNIYLPRNSQAPA
jgi:PAS domain S-box-containing protein